MIFVSHQYLIGVQRSLKCGSNATVQGRNDLPLVNLTAGEIRGWN